MNNNSCITNLMKFINLLQINSMNKCKLDDTCTRPFLGPYINNDYYNTRPITLYNKCGDLLKVKYNIKDETNESSIFRIEKINNTCVTLLILKKINDNEYISTKNFITVNTKCICAIKCLADTYVDLC